METNKIKTTMKYPLLIWLFVSLSFSTAAQEYVEQEILVMLQPTSTWAIFKEQLHLMNRGNRVQQENDDNGNIKIKKIISEGLKIALVQLPKGVDEAEALNRFNQLNSVKFSQLNYRAAYRREPNDEQYSQQWYLRRINASEAWNTTTGGTTVNGDTIAVLIIDEGFDVNHEDLKDNIWVNDAEIPNNNIDEDGNGYIDDVKGWYLSGNTGTHLPAEHGTRVAGIVGGLGNNQIGVAGINWNVKIIPFSIDLADLTAANILEGYNYALNMRTRYNQSNGTDGAFIVATNFSGGFNNTFPSSLPIFCDIYDALGESGMLNITAAPNGVNYDVQSSGDVPTLCSSTYLITVTGVDSFDNRTGSFGSYAVDLAAPAQGIFTTEPINNYGNFRSGTSFAAPQVTGAVALLYSLDNEVFGQAMENEPLKTSRLVRDAILNGVEKLDVLTQSTATGGLLNLDSALNVLSDYYEGWNERFHLVKVYPNPVDNVLTVIYQSPDVGSFDLILFNAVGQNVLYQEIEAIEWGFRRIELDMSGYNSGVYFLMLKNGEQTEITKIIVY